MVAGFVIHCRRSILTLGLFQDFGTTCPAREPPVDWVEGVAILVLVAILIVLVH